MCIVNIFLKKITLSLPTKWPFLVTIKIIDFGVYTFELVSMSKKRMPMFHIQCILRNLSKIEMIMDWAHETK